MLRHRDSHLIRSWQIEAPPCHSGRLCSSEGPSGNYSGPEVRLGEMRRCGVLLSLRSHRTPFMDCVGHFSGNASSDWNQIVERKSVAATTVRRVSFEWDRQKFQEFSICTFL